MLYMVTFTINIPQMLADIYHTWILWDRDIINMFYHQVDSMWQFSTSACRRLVHGQGLGKYSPLWPSMDVYGVILSSEMVINSWETSLRGEFSTNMKSPVWVCLLLSTSIPGFPLPKAENTSLNWDFVAGVFTGDGSPEIREQRISSSWTTYWTSKLWWES